MTLALCLLAAGSLVDDVRNAAGRIPADAAGVVAARFDVPADHVAARILRQSFAAQAGWRWFHARFPQVAPRSFVVAAMADGTIEIGFGSDLPEGAPTDDGWLASEGVYRRGEEAFAWTASGWTRATGPSAVQRVGTARVDEPFSAIDGLVALLRYEASADYVALEPVRGGARENLELTWQWRSIRRDGDGIILQTGAAYASPEAAEAGAGEIREQVAQAAARSPDRPAPEVIVDGALVVIRSTLSAAEAADLAGRAERHACGQRLRRMMQGMRSGARDGRLPWTGEGGSRWWLSSTTPPDPDLAACPQAGVEPGPGVCTYLGPRTDPNDLDHEAPLGACTHHGDTLVVLLRAGGVREVPRDGDEGRAVLEQLSE